MSKSKLEYWSGSAWVEAQTIDFGAGAQNALLSVELEDSLNNPMKAKLMVANAAREPFSTDTAADRYGPLTNTFTSFQPIRVIETDTNVVLFAGKIYDVNNEFTKDRGQVIKIYARDNLAEIADYPTDSLDAELVATTSSKRSDFVKQIIRDTNTNPHRSSLNISSDNINYGDAGKFENSARNFDEADKIRINTLGKQGLKAIYELAKNDPHEASGEIADYGYDFYVDSRYTTTASYNAAADFNYFKRGTRTPFQGTVTDFKGLWVEYPIATNFTTTGLKALMFPDYDFNLPKKDLYTGCTASISRKLITLDGDGNEKTEGINYNLEIEILDVTSISGAFTWKGKKLTKLADGSSVDADFAEELQDSSSNKVGRIQYQSSNSGTGYILLSFEPDKVTNSSLSTQKKNFNALSGTVTLTGATSGATLSLNTSTGRPSKNLGVQRPLRIGGTDTNHVNAMRRRIASALSRSKSTHTDCTVRTLPPPFTYVDTTISSVTNSTTVVLGDNVANYGFRNGMTIAKIDSNGTQTAYGYASSVSSSTVSATLNTGSWTGYSGSVRIYIPIRASHYIYAKNLLANFTGYMFLKSVVYTEGTGAQVTMYKGTGVNTAGKTIGLGIDPNAIAAQIAGESGKLVDDPNVPMGGLGWTFQATSGTDTAAFSSTDRDTIAWTGGEFTIGEMQRYKIRAGNSGNMTTSTNSDTGYPHIYKVIFDPDQDPDGSGTYTFEFIKHDEYYPDMDHINMAVARSAKLSAGKAVIIFDGTGAGMFGGIDAAGEDQFSAALFKKTLQPYTTDVVISAGTNTGANKHRYASSTAGTISFADNTTVSVEANTAIDAVPAGGSLTDNTVFYVFFKLVTSGNAETDDYTEVANAEVDRTTTYADATSGSRGLLAICSTGDVSETDEISVQAFHGKGQNITASVIAANAITADAIKAGAISTSKLDFTPVSGSNVVATINASSEGIDISAAKISISGSTTYASGYNPNTAYTTALNAQNIASDAEDDAAAADAKAVAAQEDADEAKDDLADIANDAKVAPAEKPGAKTLWDGIVAEYTDTYNQGTASGTTTERDNYATAYSNLNTYLNSTISVFSNMATVTNITRATWKSKWESYYSTRGLLLTAIAAKAQETADAKSNVHRGNSAPSSPSQGDLWYDTSSPYNTTNPAVKIYTGSAWQLRDDAAAINLATTSINGGLINTRRIVLTHDGTSSFLSTGNAGGGSGTRIEVGHDGIAGYGPTGGAGTAQFKIDPQDGKAKFGGLSNAILSSEGIQLGHATFGSAPFRVTPAGALTATSATITGAINATSGSIGNSVTIGGSTANNVTFNNSAKTDGSVGGWTIDSNQMASNNGRLTFHKDNGIKGVNSSGTTRFELKADGDCLRVRGIGASSADQDTTAGIVFLNELGGSTYKSYLSGSNASDIKYDARNHLMRNFSNAYGDVRDIGWLRGASAGVTQMLIESTSYSEDIMLDGSDKSTTDISIKSGSSGEIFFYIGAYSWDKKVTFNDNVADFNMPIETNSSLTVGTYIIHDGDPDTYIYFTSDRVNHYVGGTLTLDLEEDHVGVAGTYNPSYALYVAGDAYSTGTWGTSDDRLKTNIISIDKPLDKIKALNPVSFNWISAYQETNKTISSDTRYGFKASEYKKIFPEYTHLSGTDLIKSSDNSYALNTNGSDIKEDDIIEVENIEDINTEAIIPYLVASIKELEARIATLEGG